VVLFSPLRDLASDLRQELSPGAINLVWHRQWAGTVHEPATDALILNTPDPVDTTAVVRRVTASPTLVVGGTPSEAVTCLELGADSWLPADAPVRLIAAQLRRLLQARSLPALSAMIRVGRVVLDAEARRARIGLRELELSPREFDLLRVLSVNAGKALSRDRILGAAWQAGFVGEPKTVDVHIAWLRQKLDGSGLRVTTLRGVGYRLDILGTMNGETTAPPS